MDYLKLCCLDMQKGATIANVDVMSWIEECTALFSYVVGDELDGVATKLHNMRIMSSFATRIMQWVLCLQVN